MYYINRNSKDFGPFKESAIIDAFQRGVVLKKDLIRKEGYSNYLLVEEFLKMYSIKVKEPAEKSLSGFIKNTGKVFSDLLFPFKDLKRGWFENKTLMFLLFLVFFPALGVAYLDSIVIIYWFLAFYFSTIWAIIFYKLFSTPQVNIKYAVGIYFFTPIISLFVISILNVFPPIYYLHSIGNSENVLSRFFGMFIGVGIIEETCKALAIFYIISKEKRIISPQTAIFYGLISGLGFGIFEGVAYQTHENYQLGVNGAYFMNLIRLTSLPFFHAIWAGISAFFIAMSYITPKMKYSLRIVGILLPAFIHGLYNTFGWNFVGFGVVLFSTILLMVYLTKGKDLHSALLKTN